MPFLSDSGLAKIENTLAAKDKTITKLKEKSVAMDIAGTGVGLLEAAGAAGITGFIRGHFEKSGKPFAIGPVDIELGLGTALMGLSFWKGGVGKYAADVRMLGFGILSHYSGQLGRAMGKGQAFSPVIGMLPDHVGKGPVFGPNFVGANRDLASALSAAAG